MVKRPLDWFDVFSPPIIGLSSQHSLPVSLVGDVEGSVDPLRIAAIQLLYVNRSAEPNSSLAVTTALAHRQLHMRTPPNWFVNFASRFDQGMIDERLTAGGYETFARDEFAITRERTSFLGRPVLVDHYTHLELPFEACGFLQMTGAQRAVIIGGWRLAITSFTPLLHVLSKEDAHDVIPYYQEDD